MAGRDDLGVLFQPDGYYEKDKARTAGQGRAAEGMARRESQLEEEHTTPKHHLLLHLLHALGKPGCYAIFGMDLGAYHQHWEYPTEFGMLVVTLRGELSLPAAAWAVSGAVTSSTCLGLCGAAGETGFSRVN